MNYDKVPLEMKRQKTLALLRKNRLKNRIYGKQQDVSSEIQAGVRIGGFFKLVKDLEMDELLEIQQQLEGRDFDVRQWINQANKSSRSVKEPEHRTEVEGDQPPQASTSDGQKGFMEEALSAHFRQNMHVWLSSIEPKEELNTTSIDELKQHRSEIQYRSKLLKVMADASQRELDEIEIQIRAKTED